MPTIPATPARNNEPAPMRQAKRVSYRKPNADSMTPMWDTTLTDHYLVYHLDTNLQYHTHWISAEFHRNRNHRTIGPCNWDFDSTKVEIIWNKAMYNSRVDQMKPCAHCWAQVTTPEGWNLPPDLPDSEGEDSDVSKWDSSDDEPDSDEEFHKMPPAPVYLDPDEEIPHGELPVTQTDDDNTGS